MAFYSTSNLAVNTYNITATYSSTTPDPIADFESSTSTAVPLAVVPEGTSIDLISSASQTTSWSIGHITAGVMGITTQPTGTVTFYSNGKALGSAQLVEGQASFTTSTLAASATPY